MIFASELENTPRVETGLFIDRAIGGIARGKITEIWGDSGKGKSTLCEQIVVSFQKQGLKCLWNDVEWSYDPIFAANLGVDNSKLGIIREQFAEDNLDALERELDKEHWDLAVIDSIGGLLPRQEAEKEAGEKTIGAQSALIARFCRKVVPILAMKGTALIVINHSFTDIMTGKLMTSGGRKLDYHKSVSIRLKEKIGTVLKSGDQKVGRVIIAEVRKDKVGSNEGVEVEGKLLFKGGFTKELDLLDEALRKQIITRTGNSYFFDGNKVGTISKLREWMKDNQELIKSRL